MKEYLLPVQPVLGSHLCDRFINEGYFVIAMDNLITGDLKI
jgi:dTDP-glucose 4,6-dehydratase